MPTPYHPHPRPHPPQLAFLAGGLALVGGDGREWLPQPGPSTAPLNAGGQPTLQGPQCSMGPFSLKAGAARLCSGHFSKDTAA